MTRQRYADEDYTGDELPKWVAEGTKVRVELGYGSFGGIHTSLGTKGNSLAEPGEIGEIERFSEGWGWRYRIRFSGKRFAYLDVNMMEDLVPQKLNDKVGRKGRLY